MFGVFGRCSEGVCAADSFFFSSFFSSFFSAVSLLQLRRDGRHNRGGPGDVGYMVVLLLNVIVLFSSVSLQQAPSWEGEGSDGAGVRWGWQSGGGHVGAILWELEASGWKFKGLHGILTGLHLQQRPSSCCLCFARGEVATFSSWRRRKTGDESTGGRANTHSDKRYSGQDDWKRVEWPQTSHWLAKVGSFPSK